MAIEKTLLIVKPEAFDKKEEIKDFIMKNSGLQIISSTTLILDASDVEKIYIDDVGTNLLTAARRHLVGKPVEVCIIEGESAVEVVWELTGKNFDGNKCGPNTLRYVFGRLGMIQYDDVTYFLNAVHKTTPAEVDSALNWFYSRKEN